MDRKIAVVGLGYVGLPLAVAFARKGEVIGFDIDKRRVKELRSGHDHTGEAPPDDLRQPSLRFTADPAELERADVIIVAVPTPIDCVNNPDLSGLRGASEVIGARMKRGAVVVFESTVYPGCTEEVCVPILEKASGMACGPDFKVGYSPERINPGDKEHTLARIVKVAAGMDAETTDLLAEVYGQVVEAGVFRARDIRTAEAAKVIENTQRDLNIALMNELAMIFHRMGLDTKSVLDAAGTKWNFLPFRPGLVGGHCIGVDPYYLTYKAESLGYHPQIILAGRRINDNMGGYVASQLVKMLIRQEVNVRQARVAVLGVTFKENVPDIRNTKVVDVIRELEEYGIECRAHDPLADPEETQREYGVRLRGEADLKDMDAVVVATAHRAFVERGPAWVKGMLGTDGVVADIRSTFAPEDFPGVLYWRL